MINVVYIRLPIDNRFSAKHGSGHRIAAVAFAQVRGRIYFGYSAIMPEDRFSPDINVATTAKMATIRCQEVMNHKRIECAGSMLVTTPVDRGLPRILRGLSHTLARNWRLNPETVFDRVRKCVQSELTGKLSV
jgi:hypothetical protein